jgi:hypothetical protein
VEDLHYGNFHVGTQPSFLRQIPSGPLLNEFHSHEQQISTVGLPKPHSVPIPSSLETAATTHRLHFLRIVPSLQDAPSYPTRHNEPVPPFSSSLPIPYKHKDHIRSSTSCNPPPPRKTQRLGCRRSVPLALQRLDAPPESTPNFEPCHDCSVTCSPLCFSHDHFFYSPLLRRQSSGHPTLRLAAATAAPVQAQAQHCA